MPRSSNKSSLNDLFFVFMNVIKYVVFFILYVFAFNYMYVDNTIPNSFILLLFLHIFIIGLVMSDNNIILPNYKYSFVNIFSEIFENSFFKMVGTLLGFLIYIGPVICWIMVLITLSFIISFFSRNNKNGKLNLGDTQTTDLNTVKLLIILSIVIIAILYGFVYCGLLTDQQNFKSIEEILLKSSDKLMNKLVITLILIIFFIVYLSTVNASWLTIIMCIITIIYFGIMLYYGPKMTPYDANYFNINISDINISEPFKFLLFIFLIFIFIFSLLYYVINYIYQNNIQYIYALIPMVIWYCYIYFILLRDDKPLNNKSIFLYGIFVSFLYVISGLSLYYGGVTGGYFTRTDE